jgi:hypothetical protein
MRPFASRAGQSLIEMCCAMALMGIVCYSFVSVSDVVLTVFKNAVIQETVSSQVEPIRALLARQVRQCRFALDSTKLVSTASTGNNLNTEFALRCTRRDGNGVFIVAWETVSGGEPGLYIIPGKATGSNQGNAYNTDIPFSRSFCFFEFDVSQGYLQTTMSVPAPANGGYNSTQAVVTRAVNVNDVPAITYNVLTDSAL